MGGVFAVIDGSPAVASAEVVREAIVVREGVVFSIERRGVSISRMGGKVSMTGE